MKDVYESLIEFFDFEDDEFVYLGPFAVAKCSCGALMLAESVYQGEIVEIDVNQDGVTVWHKATRVS